MRTSSLLAQKPPLKPKKRTYNTRRIQRLEQYTVQDLAQLFGVHKNTVSHWMREGLHKIDDQKPYLFLGAEVIIFLKKRQSARKKICAVDEFYCFKCKEPRTPWGWLVDVMILNPKRAHIKGLCGVCNTLINKLSTPEKGIAFQQIMERKQQEEVSLKDCASSLSNCDIKGVAKHD
jgi:hypothetical protein